MKLADARQAASHLLRQMRLGQDPRDAKRAAQRRAQRTVAAVAEAFIAEHVSRLRSREHVEGVIRRHIVPAWGRRPISSITTEDVSELVRSLGDRPQMAVLVLSHLKGLFRWAAAPGRGYVKANPTIGLSGRHDFDIARTPRQVKLSADHLRLVWALAPQLGYPWAPFFRMLLLSGQRRGEVGGMAWAEIDLDHEQIWIIPGSRMKAGRDHEVPLTDQMVELLRSIPHCGPFVFSVDGRRPITGFQKTKDRLAEMMALPAWTIHDIRRAVRTGLGAIPSIPHDIRELVIAHVPPALSQTYDLHDYRAEKRQALTLWGERLMRIVEPTVGDVTPPRAAR